MDKNEILANFQACTGIDDIGQCLVILEEYEWNLQKAVSASLAQGSNGGAVANGRLQERGQASAPIMLTFSCKLGGIAKNITLDDSSTIGDLKEIASIELGIPLSETNFEDWPEECSVSDPPNNAVLSSLNLPHFVSLNVKAQVSVPGITVGLDAPDAADFAVSCSALKWSSEVENLTKMFELQITNKDNNHVQVLSCEGSKTVLELRQEIIGLFDIPYRKQEWNGFPGTNPPDDDQTMASLNLCQPVHKLIVSTTDISLPQPSSPTDSKPTSSLSKYTSDDSSVDGDEPMDVDDDDDIFNNKHFSTKSRSDLMPEQVDDVGGALLQFQSEFSARYGAGPNFVASPLQTAVQAAFGPDARKRKLLAVYIHHDKSIQSNVFCSQLLSRESIISYLNEHYICWPWDVTSNSNRERFLQECKQYMGSGITDTLRKLKKDEFPVLILAQGRGRSCDVTAIIQGNSEVNELMAKLIHAVEAAEEQKQLDIKEEDARKAREGIKLEQEEAYRQSLEADRAKMLVEQEAILKQEEEKRQKKKEEDEKHEAAEQLKNQLPAEPKSDCGSPISQVRFRAPDGSTFMRSFLASESLQTLVNFVGSKGFSSNEYRILKPWPKTNLLALDLSASLESHKIFPQETLIIEEKPDFDS